MRVILKKYNSILEDISLSITLSDTFVYGSKQQLTFHLGHPYLTETKFAISTPVIVTYTFIF